MAYLWAGIGRSGQPDDLTVMVWHETLSDLTEQQILCGMRRFIQEKSGEFVNVQAIRELSGAVLNNDAAAILAWDSVIDAIRIWGSYQVPQFADHVTSHVVKHLGGWVELCGTEPTHLRQWTRQAFVKAYKSLAGIVRGPAELKCLIHDKPRPTVAQIEQHANQAKKSLEAPVEPVRIALDHEDRMLLEAATLRRDARR